MKASVNIMPTGLIIPAPEQKVWLISDTHFDHTNIIRFCNRPYNSTREMNEDMIRAWNRFVKDEDLVIILGDVACGYRARPAEHFLRQLKGEKVLVLGNHDVGFVQGADAVLRHGAILRYLKQDFLLVHQPNTINKELFPKVKWLIHGHVHNTDLANYSLVNHKNKTINVSCEVTGYMPIELAKLFEGVKKAKLYK